MPAAPLGCPPSRLGRRASTGEQEMHASPSTAAIASDRRPTRRIHGRSRGRCVGCSIPTWSHWVTISSGRRLLAVSVDEHAVPDVSGGAVPSSGQQVRYRVIVQAAVWQRQRLSGPAGSPGAAAVPALGSGSPWSTWSNQHVLASHAGSPAPKSREERRAGLEWGVDAGDSWLRQRRRVRLPRRLRPVSSLLCRRTRRPPVGRARTRDRAAGRHPQRRRVAREPQRRAPNVVPRSVVTGGSFRGSGRTRTRTPLGTGW